MKKIIHKIFLLWQFDEEEKWLNKMSQKGLQLCYVGFGKYVFEKGSPNEYIYRLELLQRSEEKEYIKFIEDMGAETVCRFGRWVYFRKKSSDGEFNLFSDIESRIKHLNRILPFPVIFGGANLMTGMNRIHSWISLGTPDHLRMGTLCFTVALIGIYGFIRISSKIQKLKKEQIIQE